MFTDNEAPALISPYGGELVDLVVTGNEVTELKVYANSLPSLRISERTVCDLEMLATGAFSPLDRFMGQKDYQQVLKRMRLTGGHIFPIPVTLPVDRSTDIWLGREIALRNLRNDLLGLMTIEEIYEWDIDEMAQKVLGTQDPRHPTVAEMHCWGKLNISGRLRVLQLPTHYDFRGLRLTPVQTRERLKAFRRENVVAFQTRNPLHRAHEELTKRAIKERDGVLLLHPAVGMTKPGDVDYYNRVRTYKILTDRYYDPDRVLLSLMPLAMRMAGPREALWHALIRRNYGANHLIIGRDHAGAGLDSNGRPFYQPYDAQKLVQQFSEELEVNVVPFQELVYVPEQGLYKEVSEIPAHARTTLISGTEIRNTYLNDGKKIPDWFTRPEVVEILSESYPPRYRQGFCIWFTGLSGAGKSTTAEIVRVLLLERGRQVTLLDGDVIRTHLSRGLSFSKEDRDTNIRRIGFVASEIVHHRGAVICAAVSPYRATRNDVQNMVGKERFIEVFVNTPLEVCEQRDTKGLYAKARRGEIKSFTGIDDPYEPPQNAEIVLDTVSHTADENAHVILNYLTEKSFVRID